MSSRETATAGICQRAREATEQIRLVTVTEQHFRFKLLQLGGDVAHRGQQPRGIVVDCQSLKTGMASAT